MMYVKNVVKCGSNVVKLQCTYPLQAAAWIHVRWLLSLTLIDAP